MAKHRPRKRGAPGSGGRRPSRNAPCPCGSGGKYKACCGKGSSERGAALRPSGPERVLPRPPPDGPGAGDIDGPDDLEPLDDVDIDKLRGLFPPGQFDRIAAELGKMDEKELAEFLDGFDDMTEEEIEAATAGSAADDDRGPGTGGGGLGAMASAFAAAFEGEGGIGEDEAYVIALADHPDYAEALDEGTLPDEMTGPGGEVMNPRLHLILHTVLERQLAADTPPGVAAIMKRLQVAGLTRHDALHAMATKVTDQIFHLMKERRPFDEEHYLHALEVLARGHESGDG